MGLARGGWADATSRASAAAVAASRAVALATVIRLGTQQAPVMASARPTLVLVPW